MNFILRIVAALFATSLSGASVSLVVKDFDGRAIPGAEVTFSFRPLHRTEPQPVRVVSDANGRASAEGDARRGLTIHCRAAGHYPAIKRDIYPDEESGLVSELTLILPRVVNPIP